MKSNNRLIAAAAFGILLIAVSVAVIHFGLYGLTLFIALPAALGALGSWVIKAQSTGTAIAAGMTANAIACLGFLAWGLEGITCIFMAMPLALPLGALGGWLAYAATHKRALAQGTAMLMFLPVGLGTMGFDLTAKTHAFQVRSSIEIAAPPEQVWNNVVSSSELPPPSEWYVKAGLAYPMRARMDGRGPGAVRDCKFPAVPFVEPIQVG